MGDVSHGPEHDADVAPRSTDKTLTGRRVVRLIAFNLAAALIISMLVSLAAWQVHRRAWKHELIERIEARVHAAPMLAPPAERWDQVTRESDEYRRVTVKGQWLPHRSALVQAVTELGRGFWVVTPLTSDNGTAVLVNRGFIPENERNSASWRIAAPEPASVTGLLRISEPGGAFLRSNNPAEDRWFSRDVAAIAASRGLPPTAPFFIDAEKTPGQAGLPVPGLTVLSFSDNHLVYALTWGALALMTLWAVARVNMESISGRQRRTDAG